MNSQKLAVIGDKDSIILFKTLGFLTYFPPLETDEISKVIRRLDKEGVPIIFITEEYAQMVPETIDNYKYRAFPAIIPIPNKNGSIGIGMKGIKENVEKAIGTDILNN